MSIEQVLQRTGPRKLLAIDGGGIRGVISMEILKRIETLLRAQENNPNLVLADYFDYIAGTSIGAVIATGLALGKSVDELRSFYREGGREIFTSAGITKRWHHKFTAEKLTERLKHDIGAETKLGSPNLRTLLMLVLRNASTDSPWPICNNPRAMFNDRTQSFCNLEFPLWQLVRASTAAPTYFPPEVIDVEGKRFVFVDGAMTNLNNPAFHLFLMATAAPYRLGWPTGEDQLFLVSVGTGTAAAADLNLRPEQMNLLYNAGSAPSTFMAAALHQQDFLCRVFGRCLGGAPMDYEIGSMLDGGSVKGDLSTRIPSFHSKDGPVPKLFTYVRYNADLSREGLDKLGLTDIESEQIRRMDCPDNIPDLERVGKQVGERDVTPDVFTGFHPHIRTD